MSLSQDDALDNPVIEALYIEAVRKGQPQWFRVATGSMHPLLRIGEQVRIAPATAAQLQIGEIAAFETGEGLVIHRVVQRRQQDHDIQLIEMSDVHLRANAVSSMAVVGRVIAIQHGTTFINLQHPVAQKCGKVTAHLRNRLYTMRPSNTLAQAIVRKSSRFVARLASWCIRRFCSSSQPGATTHPVNS